MRYYVWLRTHDGSHRVLLTPGGFRFLREALEFCTLDYCDEHGEVLYPQVFDLHGMLVQASRVGRADKGALGVAGGVPGS